MELKQAPKGRKKRSAETRAKSATVISLAPEKSKRGASATTPPDVLRPTSSPDSDTTTHPPAPPSPQDSTASPQTPPTALQVPSVWRAPHDKERAAPSHKASHQATHTHRVNAFQTPPKSQPGSRL